MIGFVSTGNFSLLRGKGHALALISFKSYLNSLKLSIGEEFDGQVIVKVRNPDGVVCRLARIVLV